MNGKMAKFYRKIVAQPCISLPFDDRYYKLAKNGQRIELTNNSGRVSYKVLKKYYKCRGPLRDMTARLRLL